MGSFLPTGTGPDRESDKLYGIQVARVDLEDLYKSEKWEKIEGEKGKGAFRRSSEVGRLRSPARIITSSGDVVIKPKIIPNLKLYVTTYPTFGLILEGS